MRASSEEVKKGTVTMMICFKKNCRRKGKTNVYVFPVLLTITLQGVVSSIYQLLYLPRKNPWYPSNGRLSVLHRWSWPLLQMELQYLRLPVHIRLAIVHCACWTVFSQAKFLSCPVIGQLEDNEY
jgi:hypothetical protein